MAVPPNRYSTSKPMVFGPIKRCIYCPSTDGLTTEHVIPFALGGAIILLDVSCPACREITRKFEEDFLRSDLGHFRAQANFPTRKKKERPTHKILTHELDGSEVRIDLKDLPTVLPVIKFPGVPGIILDKPAEPIQYRHSLLAILDTRLERAAKEHSDRSFEYTLHPEQFIRVLAKIAHGFVFATFDMQSIRPMLLDVILKGDLSQAGYLIGKGDKDLESDVATHMCEWVIFRNNNQDRFLIGARIKLFSIIKKAPTYLVIVGESDGRPQPTGGSHLSKPGGRPR